MCFFHLIGLQCPGESLQIQIPHIQHMRSSVRTGAREREREKERKRDRSSRTSPTSELARSSRDRAIQKDCTAVPFQLTARGELILSSNNECN